MSTSKTHRVHIQNIEKSVFGSDLLRTAADMVRKPGASDVEIMKSPRAAEKGEIITAIVISLAASAIYDLLKAAALRLRSHPGYDNLIELDIDGRKLRLKDITDNSC